MKNNSFYLKPLLRASLFVITLLLSLAMSIAAHSAGAPNCKKHSKSIESGSTVGEQNSHELLNIVSVGGANTEILFALGLEDCVIAVDTSSTYPSAALRKPKVGYMRALSAEPILALKPTLILLDEGAGPPEAINNLQRFGVPLLSFNKAHDFTAVMDTVGKIGQQTQTQQKAAEINQAITNDIERLKNYLGEKKKTVENAALSTTPSIAFLMNLEAKQVLLAGKHTAANSIIEQAGGVNVVSQFQGYKPVGGEALARLNPDIIITTHRAVASLNFATESQAANVEKLAAMPALKLTSAAKNQEIYFFDTQYLLGYGPRSAQAALDLAKLIYP